MNVEAVSSSWMGMTGNIVPLWLVTLIVYLACGIATVWISWKYDMSLPAYPGSERPNATHEDQKALAIMQIFFFPIWWFIILLTNPAKIAAFVNKIFFIDILIDSAISSRKK